MRYGPQKAIDALFAFSILGIIIIAASLGMSFIENNDKEYLKNPAFLGYEIPDICTNDMIKHLVKYSNMFFADEENFYLEWAGLPDSINLDDYDVCLDKLLENRYDEPSWSGTSVIDANNKFALDFYSYVKKNDQNIFFSPISIMVAFAIAYEGASDSTANEIQKVFGFPIEEQERREEFQSILKGFENTSLFGFDSEYTLHMANALWVADHFEPKKEYIDTAKTYYDSRVEKVDFVSDSGANTINDWVKKQTQNKIVELIKPEDTNKNTALIITNAIYFKGDWVIPFKQYKTQQKNFYINEKDTVLVDMMHMGKPKLNYVENDLLQMIQLPYKGDNVSMLVLLPNDMDGLDTLEKELTVENLSIWRNGLEEKMTGLHLPKFTTTTEYDLKETLLQMGIHVAFDSNAADFSGISDKQIFIGSAIHKAFVNVDEKGTEAAAATAAVVELSSGPSHTFRADHPFVFIIQDDTNGNILFIGRVVNPLL